MDWTKIKIKHYVGSGLTFTQRGYLATFCALVAHHEEYPNNRQLRENFGKNFDKILEKFPLFFGNSAEIIGQKVLEDVERVKHSKSLSAERSKAYRDKKAHPLQRVTRDVTPHRIGENRIEEYNTKGFDEFWKRYPKKVAKKYALNAWKKIKGDTLVEDIYNSLDKFKQSPAWQKDGGQFIPHPATWLNGHRWEDDLSAPKVGAKNEFMTRREVEERHKHRKMKEEAVPMPPEARKAFDKLLGKVK